MIGLLGLILGAALINRLAEMSVARSVLNRRIGWVASAIGYLVISYLLVRPILLTDVIADDFEAPFYEIRKGATTLLKSLSFGWNNSFYGGDRTRTFGTLVGSASNWFWFWASRTFGISILDMFAIIRFATFVACALAVAGFWWLSARTYFRPIRWSTALLFTSVAMFGTLQLHGMWANDPVESYPLAGYASAAIGFGVLTLAVWTTARPSVRRYAVTTLAGLLAVSYYEFNFGAVLGGAVILVAAAWPQRRQLQRLLRYGAGVACFFLVPVAWLLLSGAQNAGSNYSGRALQASGAVHTLIVAIISSLPGAAWQLSASELGGHPGISVVAALSTVAVVTATALWIRGSNRGDSAAQATDQPHAPVPDTSPPGLVLAPPHRLMLAATASAAAIYALFALALESATVKVEQEVGVIGYVYTSYAVSSAAVGLAIAVAGWWLVSGRSRSSTLLKVAVAVVALAFLSLQLSYNDRLSQTLNINIAENQTLDSAFAPGVPQVTRCEAIQNWTSWLWPDYYRAAVVEGAEAGYRAFFGAPMCPSFISPADGFDHENGTPADPQWWLEENRANIALWTPDCAHGCNGILRFQAGGLAIGHTVTFWMGPDKKVVLKVPDHWKRFAVRVHLGGTFSLLNLNASGSGVTPASVHAGPGTIPYFVDFTSFHFKRV